MREISIGCGNKDGLKSLLDSLRKQLDEPYDAEVVIEGNGGPALRLRLVDEGDPEWTEPLVDYYEG